MGQGVCKPVDPADPKSDVVNFNNATLLSDPDVKPPISKDEEALEAEERRGAEEQAEQERLKAEEERRSQEKKEAEEAEAQRRAEEEASIRAEKEAAERRRQQEAAQKAAEEARLKAEEEKRRKAAEEAMRKEEEEKARAAKEKADAKVKAEQWARNKGFKGLSAPRKALCGVSLYPLHLAVEEKDADIVKALVLSDVDKNQKNSAGKTAQQMAEKFNKNGSHEQILAVLR